VSKDITQPDPTQAVYESVLQRWGADTSYRPPQLFEHPKRPCDPREKKPSGLGGMQKRVLPQTFSNHPFLLKNGSFFVVTAPQFSVNSSA